MLWVPFYSFGFGLFMLALATRFVTQSEVPVIQAQNQYHGKFFGTIATGLIACFIAGIVFSFGQYALGADAVTSLFEVVNVDFPRGLSWIIVAAISIPLAFMYGTKYVKRVENFMKLLIVVMLVVFAAVLFTTGINVPAALKGLLIPKLPAGMEGIITLIASMTAVIGVMDWVLFNNGMLARGFSENHERLGRFDAVFGGWMPVTLVLSLVTIAFAEVFAGKPGIPESSTELADALMAVVPNILIRLGFYIGVLSIVITTMVGMSVVCATSLCQSFNLPLDSKKWYWKVGILAPHIGFLGAFFGKPVVVVVAVAAMQSLFNWISGNSWYLLGNDVRYLGRKVIQSRIFNIGVLISITILNTVFVTYLLTQIGVWPA